MAPQNVAGGKSESTTRKAPIYAHMASDGLPYCSCGDSLSNVLYAENVDRIEYEFYTTEGSDEIIDSLTPEREREVKCEDPPQVGTATFTDNDIVDIEISLPDIDKLQNPRIEFRETKTIEREGPMKDLRAELVGEDISLYSIDSNGDDKLQGIFNAETVAIMCLLLEENGIL